MADKKEARLSKGIFGVKDTENISESLLFFSVGCDANGNITDSDFVSNAKSGATYNHKNTWNSLPKTDTDGKPFDFYPRGRVEISDGKATVYCSPFIANEKLTAAVKEAFCLTESNGIKRLRLCADGSEHYKCFLT